MISIIGRKYGNSKSIMLSIRIKTDSISTAIALGKAVSEFEFSEIRRNIKAARNAYKKGAVVFLDNELQARLWRIVKELTEKDNERKIDVQTARSIISNAFEAVKGKKEIPAFKEFLDIYIDGIETGNATWNNRAKQTTSRTASNYKSMRSNLNKYETETGHIINWEDIDFLFVQKFKAWLIQRSLRNNTVTMYLSLLRSVLRTARRLHYFNNTELMENVWVPPIEETDNVYLDEAKLRELEEADLTFDGILTYIEEITDTEIKEELKKYFDKKKHCDWINTTRDILLFGCMSGQRYSDYIRISKEMFEIIKDRTFIHVQQKKTKADVYIPLTNKMQTIIDRYGGKIPYMNVNKLAKMIRLLGCLLNWSEEVTINEHRAGKIYQEKHKFYELLSTHTCRRTFATNAYRHNVPLAAIMTVTGHKSEDMLRRYLKLTGKEKAVYAAEEFDKAEELF